MAQNYKHAFECSACPGRNDEEGCPKWAEIISQNTATGQDMIMKGCWDVLEQQVAVMILQASNRPAAAVESMRNEMVVGLDKGFNKLNETMAVTPRLGAN